MKITVEQLRKVIREEVIRETKKQVKLNYDEPMPLVKVWKNKAGGAAVGETADGRRWSTSGTDSWLNAYKGDPKEPDWIPVVFTSAVLRYDGYAWNIEVDGKPVEFKRAPSFSTHDYK